MEICRANLGSRPKAGFLYRPVFVRRSAGNEDCYGVAPKGRSRAVLLLSGVELRLGKPEKYMFYYVYTLRSLADSKRYYVGMTSALETRLQKHNAGQVSTAPTPNYLAGVRPAVPILI